MNANYYALYLAIIKNITVDAALGAMELRGTKKYYTDKKPKRRRK